MTKADAMVASNSAVTNRAIPTRAGPDEGRWSAMGPLNGTCSASKKLCQAPSRRGQRALSGPALDPGCGQPAVVTLEGYSPRGAMLSPGHRERRTLGRILEHGAYLRSPTALPGSGERTDVLRSMRLTPVGPGVGRMLPDAGRVRPLSSEVQYETNLRVARDREAAPAGALAGEAVPRYGPRPRDDSDGFGRLTCPRPRRRGTGPPT